MRHRRHILRSPGRRRGTILVVAMFVLMALTGLALVHARSMRVEAVVSANRLAAAQARAVAMGAAQAVLAMGLDTPTDAVEVNGGAYWILKTVSDDDKTWAFGLVDEASKININSAPGEVLEMLPGMNTELADAIVDWRDSDSDVQGAGAESEYYTLLSDPYEAKNEPFETVEELSLVRDMTAVQLYGEDLNQNGVLDANEDDGSESDPPDNKDGKLDHGLMELVTIYSSEPTDGRVNVNALSTPTSGGSGSSKGGSKGSSKGGSGSSKGSTKGSTGSGGGDVDGEMLRILQENIGGAKAEEVYDNMRRLKPFANVLDMMIKLSMSVDDFNRIEPFLTASSTSASRSSGANASASGAASAKVLGLVNVNTASKEVLMALPGLEESDADAIISQRGESSTGMSLGGSSGSSVGSTAAASPNDPTGGTGQGLGWITQVLTPEKAVSVGGMVTTRSYQYSADIVAVSADGRAFERYRLVYDISSTTPRVLLWKRLTHLGWPLDPQILTDLRSGKPVSELASSASRSSF